MKTPASVWSRQWPNLRSQKYMPREHVLVQLRCYSHQCSAGKTTMSDTERVWEFMKKIGICMLASWDGRELQARPMAAYVKMAAAALTGSRPSMGENRKVSM